MKNSTLALLLLCSMTACGGKAMTPVTAQPDGWLDVTLPPYNAKGDGSTDDTAAFQQALTDAGKAAGGTVFAPTGRYRIKTHLSIPPATTLKGVFVAPPGIDRHDIADLTHGWGSMLMAEEGAGSDGGTPFITLAGQSAGIDGFLVFYPNQTPTNPPVKYPWTISVGTDPGRDGRALDVSIQNITLANAYDGLDLASHDNSRHVVRNVYGQPLHIAVSIDQCYDFGVLDNLHFDVFWSAEQPLLDFTYQNGIAYLFQRSDGELMNDINAWGFHVGMQFQNPTNRPTDFGSYAFITNLGLESTDIGINAIDTAGVINVTNFDWASAPNMGMYRYVVWEPAAGSKNGAHVSIHNASVANGYHHIARLEQVTGSVMLDGNTFGPTLDTAAPQIEILGGQAIVTGNNFMLGTAAYPLVHVAATAGQIVVTDNIIGRGQITIDPGATQVTVANNQAVP